VRLALFALLAGCTFAPGQPAQIVTAQPDAPRMADAKLVDVPPPPPDACVDVDHDGLCDSEDDWLCGQKPTAPGASLAMSANGGQTQFALTTITFDNGSSLIAVAPGATIHYHYDWAITDVACGGNCVDQLEYGFVMGGRAGCDVDQAISKSFGDSGHVDGTVTAPAAAGTYDFRMNIGQNFSCTYNGATNWWGGTPASSRTIAKLCVH